MFTYARLKLTAWYVLIIMLVSISFSVAMYQVLTSELDRVERIQRLRQHQLSLSRLPRLFMLDPELVEETKNRLKIILLLTDGAIFSASALAGYFLAGRTLKPIQNMVDEQNRFITDASHELRTPITSLKTEIEVNLRDKTLDRQTKKILESNLEEVNSLQSLSDNLIKLTRYQKIRSDVHFTNISIGEVVDEACKRVVNLARHKSIAINNKVKDYTVKGDRPSLVELFIIFLDNAIKYNPENTQVTLTAEEIDHFLLVSIKDQGIGIERQHLPHLFDRFYRVDRSRTKVDVEGYGLGLAIAKEIMEKHGGAVKVRSEPGKGTTFELSFPKGAGST